jgi:hypothetical protein
LTKNSPKTYENVLSYRLFDDGMLSILSVLS